MIAGGGAVELDVNVLLGIGLVLSPAIVRAPLASLAVVPMIENPEGTAA